MRLISWTFQSGSEQFIYNWKTGKRGTWIWTKETEAAQRSGQEDSRKQETYTEKA